ncbi:invasin, partial [Morganella morganii]
MSSEAYAITAGTATQGTSAIKTDKATYVSGTDMKVTVTLKDAQGNTVSGASSSLTADTVTVANAALKAGGSWTETAEGTGVYTATYTAGKAGTNLKATLTLSGWSTGVSSDAYAVTAGTAAQGTSAIKTDKATYVSGTDMKVTVTLKDAQGNTVSGASSSLTADTVTVANAALKAGGSWTETAEGTGVYTATYTAGKAGTNLKATLTLSGWTAGVSSEAYAITAGTATQGTSAIKTDKATYVSGTDMKVTVTLKDAQGNPVSGQASVLTADTVTVSNAALKAGGSWTETAEGTGVYTATYTAGKAGTNLKATLTLSGW